MLPIAGAMGYATAVLYLYGFGAYIAPISESFGWSRLQTLTGLTIASLIQAVLAIPLGMLVDRYGQRPFALAGVLLMTGGFALLSTATGDQVNWWFLWIVLAVIALPALPLVWTSAIANRFDRSRGLALAVTLCGASLGASLFPLLATWLIKAQGWRLALVWHAGIWAAIAFPIVFFFFKTGTGGRAAAPSKTEPSGQESMTLREGFRSSIYLRLVASTFFVGTSITAVIIHFVSILSEHGIGALEAAGVASLVGVSAIVGRLTTGVLLDRFQASLVGAVAFLLPMISGVLLIFGGDNIPVHATAAILIGLTLGAEVDVLAYIITKYFSLRNFGALFGGLVMAISIGGAIGPAFAAGIFDRYHTYAPFLWYVVAILFASSLTLASLPRPNALGSVPPGAAKPRQPWFWQQAKRGEASGPDLQ